MLVSLKDKIIDVHSELSMLGEHIESLKIQVDAVRKSRKLTKMEKQTLKLAVLALEGQNQAIWLLTQGFYDKYTPKSLFEVQSTKEVKCLACTKALERTTVMKPIKTAYSKPMGNYLQTAYQCPNCGIKHQLITEVKTRKSRLIISNWQW